MIYMEMMILKLELPRRKLHVQNADKTFLNSELPSNKKRPKSIKEESQMNREREDSKDNMTPLIRLLLSILMEFIRLQINIKLESEIGLNIKNLRARDSLTIEN